MWLSELAEMAQLVDLVGMKFGRLVVLSKAPNKSGASAWTCRCVCGAEKVVSVRKLRKGDVASCGCLRRDRASETKRIHGQAGTRLYHVWRGMIARCENPKDERYPSYGGRGISVCPEWRGSFERFAKDMGPRPAGMTVERRENDGNYQPGNCIWANRMAQANNRRSNWLVTSQGIESTLAEFVRRHGLVYEEALSRVRQGRMVIAGLQITAIKKRGIESNKEHTK